MIIGVEQQLQRLPVAVEEFVLVEEFEREENWVLVGTVGS